MIFWVMDLNPDEAIAAGWLKPDSGVAKFLAALLKSSLQHAERIVVLDRFMKERITAKGIPGQKIAVVPPSCDESVEYDQEGREAFRRRHDLSEKFVVMHAGNHSPCHPLDTLLEAGKQLRCRDDIVFCFVGGGSEMSKVREFSRANQLENIRCLPYQPELSAVLSAADLHVVIMGDGYQGIIHPSKIYNILAIGSPFLYIGPLESHLGEIISGLPDAALARHAEHGDSQLLVQHILKYAGVSHSAAGHRQPANGLAPSTVPLLIAQIEPTTSEPTYVAQTSGISDQVNSDLRFQNPRSG